MAEDFGNAPGLRNAAHWPGGRLRLEDLADRAQAGIEKVRPEWLQKLAGHLRIALDAKVRVEIRSHEPGPRHPHVIGGVARALIASVGRLIAGVIGTEGPQSVWRQELRCDQVESQARAIALDH